jgi:hypothetical protein
VRLRKAFIGFIALMLLSGLVAACGSTNSSSGGSSSIRLIKRQSFCTTTGIADVYTGDGKVQFWLTFRNAGTSNRSVTFTPVRRYDDGQVNESAMNESSTDVAAGQTWKGKTNAFSYKAHEHEVVGCTVRIGETDYPIRVVSLGS